MSIEYRRGIPSTAHVEAATRLGLEWEEVRPRRSPRRWRFQIRDGELWCDFWSDVSGWDRDLEPLSSGRIADRTDVEHYTFRPIRPDGTLVDWEVLDQEVARVGLQGQPATATSAASTAQTTQPQGFRADLWRRMCQNFLSRDECELSLSMVEELGDNEFFRFSNGDRLGITQDSRPGYTRTDILTRWTVYQELKPLYDLVDGAQGEAAMPRDVEAEWYARGGSDLPVRDGWRLSRDCGEIVATSPSGLRWFPSDKTALGQLLSDFAVVLDAAAERRVAERMRGQAQDTSAQPEQHRHNWIYDGLGGGHNGQYNHNCACGGRDWFAEPMSAPSPHEAVVATATAQPEPVLDEAALRALIRNLPNVASITGRIERGLRQRDRYIVRVRLADPNVPLDRTLASQIPRNVHVHCEGCGDGSQRGFGGTAAVIYSPTGNREDAVAPPIQAPQQVNVEPRRFADVRPDRHVWRWWLVRHALPLHQTWLRIDHNRPYDWSTVETVIPTDEQGNPVSWEAAGFIDVTLGHIYDPTTGTLRDTARIRQLDRFVAEAIQAGNTSGFSIESPAPPRPGQFSNNPATLPLTPEGFQQVLETVRVGTVPYQETLDQMTSQILAGAVIGVDTAKAPPITTPPLPRFTTDELDDVDHSKTTKLDEVTLRRGKLPTVEQIAKYREVRARRTGGTVADALKESRIDCEVAQYVLERWAGGLGDEESRVLIETASRFGAEHKVGTHLPAFVVDSRIRWYTQNNQTLDTSEKPSPTVQRERQEAEERRQRLAELRQRLATERAVQPQEMAKGSDAPSRFDLIEPDPRADPTASIRAWEARQAAAKVRPVAVTPRTAKPAAAPRRPVIEVVDAEADGLSRVEVVTALFGRALNGGC